MPLPPIMQVLHQGGGAGSVTSTLYLSLGLAKAGWDVRFVCPPDSEVEALARERGLAVRPLALPPHSRRENAAALARLIAAERVALVNSQSARDRTALTWLGMSGRLTVPLIATRRQIPRTMFLENWIASRIAARVIAVSTAVADALVRRGTPRRKVVVIPNGLVAERVDRPVPPDAVEQWRARIGWEPGRRTLGIVSRRKDQAVVLAALAQVRTPLRLVLVGTGVDESLAEAAERVPSRHAVVMLPFVSDVRPLYELLELVLLPSRMEGLSQALLEAMALGKPVIASAAGGNLDLITDGVNGRLVPPRNSVAWARVIEELLSSPEAAKRLGESARYTAREEYTLERTVERTIQLYRSVLARS